LKSTPPHRHRLHGAPDRPRPRLTSEDVFHLAEQGNERAVAIFRSVGEALGVALANLINIFNFPLYLLSGGPCRPGISSLPR